jgi:hypothetical protein
VQVHCDEGVAIRIGPESCAGVREGAGEALTGGRTGQPSSRERRLSRVPTSFGSRKATRTGALCERPAGPARSQTLACAHAPCVWEPGDLALERSGSIGTGPPVRVGEARSRSRR